VACLQARGYLRTERGYLNSVFFALLLFTLFVFCPIGFYLIFTYTSWSWMYWVEPQTTTPLVNVAAIYSYLFASMMGSFLSQWLLKSKRDHLLKTSIYLTSGILILFSGFSIQRLLYIGRFEEWTQALSLTTPIWQHRLAAELLVAALLFCFGLSHLFKSCRKLG